MFYSLLGRTVWYGLKLFLRQKYGRPMVPRPVLAGGAAALVAGAVALILLRARD